MATDVRSPGNASDALDAVSPAVATLVLAIQRLALARSVETIQEVVRAAARELSGADGATFVLREGAYCFYADEDAIAPLWKGQRFPMETCISGWAMLHGQAVCIRDIYADERIPHDAYRPTFVKSLAMMPIRTLDPVGAIGIYWAHEHEPTTEELSLLAALADSTAVALENVAVYEELEERVRLRTSELHAANKALDDFSWRAAHDLRSPLAVIRAAAETLERPQLSAEQRAALARAMLEQAERATELVDDLLDLARASGTARREDVDVHALLEAIRTECPDVDVNVGAVPARISVDPVTFRQALLNIVRNAAAYASHDGRAVVDVEAYDDGGLTVFALGDRGPGLPDDLRANAFQPFQRGDSDGEAGSGLGLAIVRAMAEAHGGRAWCESRPGGGAVFKIALADAP